MRWKVYHSVRVGNGFGVSITSWLDCLTLLYTPNFNHTRTSKIGSQLLLACTISNIPSERGSESVFNESLPLFSFKGGPPTQLETASYYICFAIHGVCSGTAMTQMVIVLSDWVGPDRLAKSLAIMMVTLGLLYVPAQAVMGRFFALL